MAKEQIEYRVGKVKLIVTNLLVSDITDMEVLEYWEDRLVKLKQPFAVTFKEKQGKIVYSIYTNLKRKNSPFRVSHA